MSQFNEMQSEGTHDLCKRLMHLLLEIDERLSQLNDCMYSHKDEQYKANQEILQRLKYIETSKATNLYPQTVYVSSKVSKQTEADLSTCITSGTFIKQLQSTTKQNDAIQDEDKTSTNGNIESCKILISDDGNEEKQCKTLPDVSKEIDRNRLQELEFLHYAIEKQELEGLINYDDYILSDSTNEIGEVQRESVKNLAGEEENNLSLSEGHLDIPPKENRNTKAPEFTLDEMSPEDFEYSNCLSPGDDDNATVHEITELPDGKNVTDISKRAQKEPRGETDSNILSEEQKILDIAGLPGTTSIKRAIESALHNDNVYHRSDRGLDTVVCVDTSASTGKYFDQIKSTLYSFIDAVEENVVATGLEENISIVTIDTQTKVLQPLTNDYGVLRDKVESLTCSGTSPILTALLLCYLIIKEEGNAISICGYNVPARIILITDGRPTDDAYMDNLSLEYAPKDPRIQKKIETLTQQLTMEGCQLFTVNVGRNSNKDFLERLAMLSGAKSFGLDDMKYLSQYFLYQYFAGKVIKICRENQYEDKYQEIVTAEIERLRCKRFDEQDKKNIIELIEASQELMYKEYPGLPHLGARILLSLSDVQSTGTVVQHRDSGWIKIKLDAQGYHFFHYQTNVNDLTIIDEPLRLRSNQIMAVGVKVVSEEGVVGTVFETTDVGFIRVAWDNGTKERIEYASVKIHGSSSSSSSSS